MKRTVAFLAVVCVSIGVVSVTAAHAQQSPPAPAPSDTTTGDSPQAPAAPTSTTATPAAAAPDTTGAGAKARRAHVTEGQITYFVSLGLGSAINYNPDSFADNYSPSMGTVLSVGGRRYGVTVAVTFDYNFFFANGTTPDDLNILTIFADLRYAPVHSTARPYLIVCGGYYRQWIVDTGYTENVLGYGGGAGVELELDKARRIFLEGRYIQGQTRELDETKANTEVIPFRLGVTWEIN